LIASLGDGAVAAGADVAYRIYVSVERRAREARKRYKAERISELDIAR
jgi:hypothetical protein